MGGQAVIRLHIIKLSRSLNTVIMADNDAAITKTEAGDATQAEETKKALAGLGGLMQNPQILAALQGHLESMVGQNSGYVKSLPKVVQRRIKALKKPQAEMCNVECKFQALYQPLYDRRRDVLTGITEPSDEDCEWPSDDEDDDEVTVNGEVEKKDAEKDDDEEEEKPDGIPSFWLTVLKNVDMTAELVQEHDEPILEKMKDITITFSKADPMAFTLNFHFAANEYFTNAVLTKEYIMRSTPEEDDPLSFEGPEIVKCKGCKIDWAKGKNLTVKQVKKTQKKQGAGGGQKRTITKTVKNESFFNFFSPPESAEGDEEVDEVTEAVLAQDYETGHFFRDRVIPRAVLYFTGEAHDDESDDEEGEDDEGEYDEDEDEDFEP